MLYFSRTKILLIFLAIFFALLFAFPNIFSESHLKNFPSFLPKQKVNLGLDLQGGSHLLLEVDTNEIIKERIENLSFDLRRLLKKNDIGLSNLKIDNESIIFFSSQVTSSLVKEIEDLSISNSQSIMQISGRTNLIVQNNNNEFITTFILPVEIENKQN